MLTTVVPEPECSGETDKGQGWCAMEKNVKVLVEAFVENTVQ